MPSPWEDAQQGGGTWWGSGWAQLPPKIMGSQLDADSASEDGARWLLVWGCSSGWLASFWHPGGVLPYWELLGGNGAQRMLILGRAIIPQPMSYNYPALPRSPPQHLPSRI